MIRVDFSQISESEHTEDTFKMTDFVLANYTENQPVCSRNSCNKTCVDTMTTQLWLAGWPLVLPCNLPSGMGIRFPLKAVI